MEMLDAFQGYIVFTISEINVGAAISMAFWNYDLERTINQLFLCFFGRILMGSLLTGPE